MNLHVLTKIKKVMGCSAQLLFAKHCEDSQKYKHNNYYCIV